MPPDHCQKVPGQRPPGCSRLAALPGEAHIRLACNLLVYFEVVDVHICMKSKSNVLFIFDMNGLQAGLHDFAFTEIFHASVDLTSIRVLLGVMSSCKAYTSASPLCIANWKLDGMFQGHI